MLSRRRASFRSKPRADERHVSRSGTMKRVVVTGLGLVTPLGCGASHVWNALLAGQCGIKKLEGTEYSKIPSRVAATVTGFNPDDYVTSSERRTMSMASVFAVAAASEAVKDAGITDTDPVRKSTGVAIGMGMADLECIIESADALRHKGPSRISPYFVPRILTNMAAGVVSIRHGLEGPNHSVSTACATGAHSIGKQLQSVTKGILKQLDLNRRCWQLYKTWHSYCNGLWRHGVLH